MQFKAACLKYTQGMFVSLAHTQARRRWEKDTAPTPLASHVRSAVKKNHTLHLPRFTDVHLPQAIQRNLFEFFLLARRTHANEPSMFISC